MTLAFLLGRYLFHDAVSSLLLRRVPNFAAIDRGVAQEGWKLVLLLRLSPLMPYNVSDVLGRRMVLCCQGISWQTTERPRPKPDPHPPLPPPRS
jgi:hypothetical protein